MDMDMLLNTSAEVVHEVFPWVVTAMVLSGVMFPWDVIEQKSSQAAAVTRWMLFAPFQFVFDVYHFVVANASRANETAMTFIIIMTGVFVATAFFPTSFAVVIKIVYYATQMVYHGVMAIVLRILHVPASLAVNYCGSLNIVLWGTKRVRNMHTRRNDVVLMLLHYKLHAEQFKQLAKQLIFTR
mmetsp:Transcript_13930/g.27519  ORF Transcript_13930/g.27519 Transcript_13930/m.27519 type:complete len:184 (+) Transcript_13930:217-768(+)